MIVEYHRPETIGAALALLDRQTPISKPMGGGTILNRPSDDPIAVIDLQLLSLNRWESRGISLNLGACLTLQSLLGLPELQEALRDAILHEASYNLRQVATLAGSLVACNGRSPLATTLLSMDASLEIIRSDQEPVLVSLGDFLPVREQLLKGALVTRIVLPSNARLAYTFAARTPADLPIVCVAVSQWSSGRTRIALGGWGKAPTLALDGPDASGAQVAAENVCMLAGDEWASAEYRQHAAGVLTARCLTTD